MSGSGTARKPKEATPINPVKIATKRHHHRGTSSEGANLPARGMTMAQVEQRFGAPAEKLAPAGGDTARHPTINRWRYNGYTVYFERNRVLHNVVDEAPPAPKS